MKRMSSSHHRWWQAALALYLVACTALDLFPRYQLPEFRYTGSDPTQAVWSLGWPFALAVYDPHHGFFVGPFTYLVVPFQLGLLVFAFLLVLFVRWLPPQKLTGSYSGEG